jgi:hypothetical protein
MTATVCGQKIPHQWARPCSHACGRRMKTAGLADGTIAVTVDPADLEGWEPGAFVPFDLRGEAA